MNHHPKIKKQIKVIIRTRFIIYIYGRGNKQAERKEKGMDKGVNRRKGLLWINC